MSKTKEKDQKFQEQIQQCLSNNDNKEALQKLGIDAKDLSAATKSKDSFKKFIDEAIGKAEQKKLISSDEKQKLIIFFNNIIKQAEKQNLVDFKKDEKNNPTIKNFAEAHKNDDIRGQIETNWQPANIENSYMRMFFESLNNLLKTLLHTGATVSYADTVKNQTNQEERKNRLNSQQSFKKGNQSNDLRQSLQKPKTPPPQPNNLQQQQPLQQQIKKANVFAK